MRFGGATEANRMQKPTSDDNRRGVTRGGEAPKALTAENDVELALTVSSTGHGTNVQLVAAHIRPITFLLSGLITTATHQDAHDVRSLNEDHRAVV